ncbi:oxidative stress-induced growth inhibitor 2-like [Diabrotica virgifera virgifera]|uniref:Oxidative stress-induced growth inhibitor 2-like n=1 Tax=Diabrotica virgifera virgifera TaxID=50390 RepID=A0ABM5KG85_DIAVI|nr:oxidative stress-induced growth inhibitor 2-like [Diabrotica virgifera virgifera]XP_050509207.1 oxidative stress-induced growth inhibitor 2-like [Diabrotica virgifera virgifera]
MKSGNQSNIIYKEVVIVGNGPSGIVLSFILSGNIPYITSDDHPDEMLSARLSSSVGECLLQQDLEFLAQGIEGRSTNQVSLLVDSLLHPYADMGWDLEPLLEFKRAGKKIEHIVLGKGPPGGSWHSMDPQILTLSLGSWMALPGLPFNSGDSGEKRAFACDVAKYYVQYTEQMGLTENFHNYVSVNSVEQIEHEQPYIVEKRLRKKGYWTSRIGKELKETLEACIEREFEENCTDEHRCWISNAIDCLMLKNRRKIRCKRPRDQDAIIIPRKNDKRRSISFCCDTNDYNNCDSFYSTSLNERFLRNSFSLDLKSVPSYNSAICDKETNWIVNAVDSNTGEKLTYACKYLVLANGGSDLPNRLEVSKVKKDPEWILYDLRSLEKNLDSYLANVKENVAPVLVIGAGLSAADAIIAARGRNVPVIHVFRQKSPELSRHLQENLYPEYHKVHQMMLDGGSTHSYYTAYPEYTLSDFDAASRTVILTSKDGVLSKLHVSFAVILIGSRPDLSFLPEHINLGVQKNLPLDCKTNPADVNRLTHSVNGCENLFVIGPLAGDNFVRFLPGGAVAVTSELYRRKYCT